MYSLVTLACVPNSHDVFRTFAIAKEILGPFPLNLFWSCRCQNILEAGTTPGVNHLEETCLKGKGAVEEEGEVLGE